MAKNTVKARIQLKNDTEQHWNLAEHFVPLQGEVIIYSTDDTHPFSRLKVGDGETTINQLPFIDSGTINGFSLTEDFDHLPSIGDSDTLYYNAAENAVYGWDNEEGYYKKYDVIKEIVNSVKNWDGGQMTRLSVDEHNLIIENGTEPTLSLENIEVVTGYGPVG